MANQPEINEHGNRVERSFLANADRYVFDFNECTPESGWLQVDTMEDAPYFGVWVHPEKRETLSFIEGDVIRVFCADDASYNAEIADICECYQAAPGFLTINPEEGVVTQHYQDRSELVIDPPEPE